MKLPPQAHRVFKGNIFDVYQWEQELFDGSKATFEMLKRVNTLEIIPIVGDNILVAKEKQPGRPEYFSLFGGRQDEGETPLEGAKRELLEETGYTSDNWELFSMYEPTSKIEWDVYTYIAKNGKKKQEPLLDPGEHIEIMTLTFEAFLTIILSSEWRSKEIAFHILKLQTTNQLEAFKKRLFSPITFPHP